MKKTEKKAPAVETRGRKPIGKIRSIKVSDADWQTWTDVASSEGKSVSEWIRGLCSKAVKGR